MGNTEASWALGGQARCIWNQFHYLFILSISKLNSIVGILQLHPLTLKPRVNLFPARPESICAQLKIRKHNFYEHAGLLDRVSEDFSDCLIKTLAQIKDETKDKTWNVFQANNLNKA